MKNSKVANHNLCGIVARISLYTGDVLTPVNASLRFPAFLHSGRDRYNFMPMVSKLAVPVVCKIERRR